MDIEDISEPPPPDPEPEPPSPPGPLPGTPKGIVWTVATKPSVPKLGSPMELSASIKNTGTGRGTFKLLILYVEKNLSSTYNNIVMENGDIRAFSVGNVLPVKSGENHLYANLQMLKSGSWVFQDEKTLAFPVSSGTASASTMEALKRQRTIVQGNPLRVIPRWS